MLSIYQNLISKASTKYDRLAAQETVRMFTIEG